jgi:hypothetical protein
MTTYSVFSRKPWRRVRPLKGSAAFYTPNPGARKMTLARGLTIEQARAHCAQGPANQARAAGREYRNLTFYEFTQE